MRVPALVVFLAISMGLLIPGCGGGAASTPPSTAPQIVTPPANQTVTAGQSATFSVTATGKAPLSYQWNKNGTAISGATSSSYTTPPTTAADNGDLFNVVVSDPLGNTASTAATLTVTGGSGAPSIIAQPVNQTVTAGQSATFSVTATGTAPLSYQWNKNGTAISGATSAAYTTPPTTTADSGAQFTVVVSNTSGSITSAAATLTVNPGSIAPTITVQPSSQTVTAGQTASFSVTATGTASFAYQWHKNGLTINGAISPSYTTPATTSTDNGAQFDVAVSNTAGSVNSQAATLTVTAATAVKITTTSLPNGTAQVAYSTTLQATGGTLPYTWSVSSGQLPAGLSLGASGTISGTPTTAGLATFTIQVADNVGNKSVAGFSVIITSASQGPFGHIVIVLEENTDYLSVVGTTAMPYLNALISQYGLATQYYATTHPSIGNYMDLTTGQILTNDDSQTPATFPVSVDNVVRELLAAGKTWKAYGEGLPSVGYTGGDIGNFAIRHYPLAYMTDVQNSQAQLQNLVPFTQFATDLAAGNLPNYSWVTPNLCDDAHDCPLSTADTWLQTNIDPLIKNPSFQKDGLLIVVFDESGSDNTNGGGRVVCVLISPASSKVAFQSTTLYQHPSVLRLTLEGLGVKNLPGAAVSAPPMWEFFTFPAP